MPDTPKPKRTVSEAARIARADAAFRSLDEGLGASVLGALPTAHEGELIVIAEALEKQARAVRAVHVQFAELSEDGRDRLRRMLQS